MQALPPGQQAAMLQALRARMQGGAQQRDPRRVPEEGAYDGWGGPGRLMIDGLQGDQTLEQGDSMSGRMNAGPGTFNHLRPAGYPMHPQPDQIHQGVPPQQMSSDGNMSQVIAQLLGNTRSARTSNIDSLRARFAKMAAAGMLGRGR